MYGDILANRPISPGFIVVVAPDIGRRRLRGPQQVVTRYWVFQDAGRQGLYVCHPSGSTASPGLPGSKTRPHKPGLSDAPARPGPWPPCHDDLGAPPLVAQSEWRSAE
jgi:hypothetical protein